MKLRVALPLAAIVLAAGCLANDPDPAPAGDVAPLAEASGDGSLPGPAAPTGAYTVEAAPATEGDGAEAQAQSATAYPVRLATSAAKAPVTREFAGTYEPQDCTPNGGVPLGGLGFAEGSRFHDFTDDVAVGDVLSYDLRMTWTNTDASWAEIHLGFSIGSAGDFWQEPTSEVGERTINFTGQAFRGREEEQASLFVNCWYGQITEPIAYSITIALTFAEGAIPSSLPVQVAVPAGATRLFVSGLPASGAEGTPSHFRVFRPDDTVLCECALASDDQTAGVALDAGAGNYVVLVDHTANGFVTLALDAPNDGVAIPLALEWQQFDVFTSDGAQAVDETIAIDVPTVPLDMGAWVFAAGASAEGPFAVGLGKAYRLTVSNARGDVVRQAMAGHFTYRAAAPPVLGTSDWLPLPVGDEWEFTQDHHAYDLGEHTVRVTADAFRGDVVVWARQYVRV